MKPGSLPLISSEVGGFLLSQISFALRLCSSCRRVHTVYMSNTETTATKFTCLYNGPTLRNEFEIHKPGCRDIAKHEYNGASTFTVSGSTVTEAVQKQIDVFQSQDQGWGWQHFHVLPCAK